MEALKKNKEGQLFLLDGKKDGIWKEMNSSVSLEQASWSHPENAFVDHADFLGPVWRVVLPL